MQKVGTFDELKNTHLHISKSSAKKNSNSYPILDRNFDSLIQKKKLAFQIWFDIDTFMLKKYQGI